MNAVNPKSQILLHVTKDLWATIDLNLYLLLRTQTPFLHYMSSMSKEVGYIKFLLVSHKIARGLTLSSHSED